MANTAVHGRLRRCAAMPSRRQRGRVGRPRLVDPAPQCVAAHRTRVHSTRGGQPTSTAQHSTDCTHSSSGQRAVQQRIDPAGVSPSSRRHPVIGRGRAREKRPLPHSTAKQPTPSALPRDRRRSPMPRRESGCSTEQRPTAASQPSTAPPPLTPFNPFLQLSLD